MSEAERRARWRAQRLMFDLIRVSLSKPCRPPRKPRRGLETEPAPTCSPCSNRPRSRSSKKSVLGQMFYSFSVIVSSFVCVNVWLFILETRRVTITLLQAFTIMDQNRDGFIDKNDLRDTFAALGKITCVSLIIVPVSSVCLMLLMSTSYIWFYTLARTKQAISGFRVHTRLHQKNLNIFIHIFIHLRFRDLFVKELGLFFHFLSWI